MSKALLICLLGSVAVPMPRAQQAVLLRYRPAVGDVTIFLSTTELGIPDQQLQLTPDTISPQLRVTIRIVQTITARLGDTVATRIEIDSIATEIVGVREVDMLGNQLGKTMVGMILEQRTTTLGVPESLRVIALPSALGDWLGQIVQTGYGDSYDDLGVVFPERSVRAGDRWSAPSIGVGAETDRGLSGTYVLDRVTDSEAFITFTGTMRHETAVGVATVIASKDLVIDRNSGSLVSMTMRSTGSVATANGSLRLRTQTHVRRLSR